MRQIQRIFRLNAFSVFSHPVGRIEKQWLGTDKRLHADMAQQILTHLKAAPGMGMQAQPAVDHHDAIDTLRIIQRQLQANQTAQRMAHNVKMGNAMFRQRVGQLGGHIRQLIGFRQGVLTPAGATLIVLHYAELFL